MSKGFLLLLRRDPGFSEVRFSAYKITCCLLGYGNLWLSDDRKPDIVFKSQT